MTIVVPLVVFESFVTGITAQIHSVLDTILEYPLQIEWNTFHVCLVSSGLYHPSGLMQSLLPIAVNGKMTSSLLYW